MDIVLYWTAKHSFRGEVNVRMAELSPVGEWGMERGEGDPVTYVVCVTSK